MRNQMFTIFVIYPLVSMITFTIFGDLINKLFPLTEDPKYKRDKLYRIRGTNIKLNPRKMGSLFFRAIIYGMIFRILLFCFI